ncbi:MAG: holo-ACP synthase [Sphaerochaetaceae bacterium]|nr:holo-ACP synthase [Sphaerochaetaceae bacterium]MDC7237390.1 holo-ACP synthase [Sphaerochaetaceae bacterium]
MNKIGVDIVNIERISKLNDYAIKRLFNKVEVDKANSITNEKSRVEFLAGRFAAKEALAKALGVGFTKLIPSEIVITNLDSGQPEIKIEGKTLEAYPNLEMQVSISHDYPCAVAVVLVEDLNGKS